MASVSGRLRFIPLAHPGTSLVAWAINMAGASGVKRLLFMGAAGAEYSAHHLKHLHARVER